MAAPGITVLKNNAPWGPFTRAQIEDGLARGDYTVQYLAHVQGLSEWLPLGEVIDFVDRNASKPLPSLPPVPGSRDLPPIPQRVESKPAPPARPPILPAPRPEIPAPVAAKPESKPEPKPEQKPAVDLRAAPFIRRSIAFFLDGAILFLPVLFLTILGALCIEIPAAFRPISHQTRMEEWDLLALNASRLSWLIIGFGWLYGAACESGKGQATIGKRWLGLKIIDANGDRIDFFRALRRNLAKYLSGLICFLGFFAAMFGKNKLALHDWLSDTRAVRR